MLPLHQHDVPPSRLAMLRELSMFAGLSDAELRRVDALTCEIEVPAGTVLMKQGQVGREVFIVARGVADVAVDGRTIARVGPGEPLGEAAVLACAPRSATVTALMSMGVLVLDPGQFADLLGNPRIGHTIAGVQTRRHRGVGRSAPRAQS
jgi:CRP/FNR family transcriptional regulator, cyclic AMP receptor protein